MMKSNGPVLDGVLSSVDVSLEEPFPVVDNNNNNIPKSEEATADQSQIQSEIQSEIQSQIQSSIDKKKKYLCEICKIASFTRKHNLKSHLLTHTDSKPFQCSYCSSNFRRNYDLKRHEKIHTKEKPYICLKCGKSFSRADTLLRHNSSNTGCNLNNNNNNNKSITNDNNNNTKKRKPRSKTSIKSLKKQKRIDDNQINKDITTLIPLNDETNFFAQHSIENNNNNNNNTSTTTIPSNFEEIVKISSLINEVVSKSSNDSNGINESLTEGQSIILKKALTLLGDIETRLKKPETELDSQSTEPQLQPEHSEQLEITTNQLDQQQSHIQTALDNMNDSIQPELIN